MLQEYSKTCSVYFEQPRTQREYLLYCRALLQDGKVEEAKQLLTVTERYNWPETLRYTDLDDLSQPQPNHSSTMKELNNIHNTSVLSFDICTGRGAERYSGDRCNLARLS